MSANSVDIEARLASIEAMQGKVLSALSEVLDALGVQQKTAQAQEHAEHIAHAATLPVAERIEYLRSLNKIARRSGRGKQKR